MDFEIIDRLMLDNNPLVKDKWLDDLCITYQQSISARIGYYKFLYRLVMFMKPRFCLELGVESGIASAHMARAAMTYGGHVIGIDLHWHNVPGVELPMICNYTFMLGSSVDRFEEVAEYAENTLGVVFQDSSHHYRESIDEWNLYSTLMPKGSVWVCDDVHKSFYDPKVDPPGMGMLEYFNSLPGQKKVYPYANGGNATGVVLI